MTVFDLIKVYEGPINVLNDANVNLSEFHNYAGAETNDCPC